MRRIVFITFLLLAAMWPLAAAGGGFRPVYGLEYGLTATISEWHHTNYRSPEGPRVNQIHTDFEQTPLGYFGMWAGLEYARHWSTAMVLSINGISRERTVSSLSLRMAYFLKSYDQDGVKLFLEGGAGVTETFKGLVDVLGKAGASYRFVLADRMTLEMQLAFQMSLDHPATVIDRYSGNILTQNSILRSDAVYTGINIGLALSF